jgi:hypothetical protein
VNRPGEDDPPALWRSPTDTTLTQKEDGMTVVEDKQAPGATGADRSRETSTSGTYVLSRSERRRVALTVIAAVLLILAAYLSSAISTWSFARSKLHKSAQGPLSHRLTARGSRLGFQDSDRNTGA